MEKKYRLLKDLPGTEAGTIFTQTKHCDLPDHAKGLEAYSPEGIICPQFIKSDVQRNPKWFEEIDEEILFTRKDLKDCMDYTLDLMKKCNAGALNYMNQEGWIGTKKIVANWKPTKI